MSGDRPGSSYSTAHSPKHEEEKETMELRRDLMRLMMGTTGDELRVKIQYMDEKSALNLQRPVDFRRLESYLQSKYQRKLNIYYTTMHRDLVTQIRNQDELDHAIKLYDQSGSDRRMRLVLSQRRNQSWNYPRPPLASGHKGIVETTLSDTSSLQSWLSTPSQFRDGDMTGEMNGQSPSLYRPPTRWRDGRCLGRGAFGCVYACLDIDTGEQLAVKKIRIVQHTSTVRGRLLTSLENEITLLGTLHHPHIVQYYGVQADPNGVNIFMEFMAGGSLRDQINDYGALTEANAVLFTTQLLKGLGYLHIKGLVHRDIKPANCLRHARAHVKLGDFGSAKYLQALCSEEGVEPLNGTPHYLPPEIIKGSKKYEHRSDIWSLGITVVEMLTAKTPWWDVEVNAVCLRIASIEKVELPPIVNCGLKASITRMLEVPVDKRPTTGELLAVEPFKL